MTGPTMPELKDSFSCDDIPLLSTDRGEALPGEEASERRAKRLGERLRVHFFLALPGEPLALDDGDKASKLVLS